MRKCGRKSRRGGRASEAERIRQMDGAGEVRSVKRDGICQWDRMHEWKGK